MTEQPKKGAAATCVVMGATILSFLPFALLLTMANSVMTATERNDFFPVFMLSMIIFGAFFFLCLGLSWIFFVLKKYKAAVITALFPFAGACVIMITAGIYFFRELAQQ